MEYEIGARRSSLMLEKEEEREAGNEGGEAVDEVIRK